MSICYESAMIAIEGLIDGLAKDFRAVAEKPRADKMFGPGAVGIGPDIGAGLNEFWRPDRH